MRFSIYIFLVILLATACNVEESTNEDEKVGEVVEEFESLDFDSIAAASIAYTQDRDLDGDGIDDEIYFEFTGGAHCCYYMSLDLSSKDSLISYPFEMDGGYMLGVDDSSPHHFQIKDFDEDGIPEIYMEIYTYNGEVAPIKAEWKRDYGITSNYILFDFKNGAMEVKDYTPIQKIVI